MCRCTLHAAYAYAYAYAYAQAKELALAPRTVPLLTAGSIQTEARAGGQFVYRYRYDANGKRITEYLGAAPEPATAAKLEPVRQEMDEQAVIADYSRKLRAIGFYSADNSTLVTLLGPTIPSVRKMCCRWRCWRKRSHTKTIFC